MTKNIYDRIFDTVGTIAYFNKLLIQIYKVSGYELEQLLDLFKAGYELRPPSYSGSLSEIDFPIEDKNND